MPFLHLYLYEAVVELPIPEHFAELLSRLCMVLTGLFKLLFVIAGGEGKEEVEHLFLARIDATARPDRHEAIKELCVIGVAEFETRIRDGVITDAPTLAAFLRARLRGLL